MRWKLLPGVFAAGVVCLGQLCQAQQSFPYKAYITADEVYVRSGPGQSYYPTDKLKRGQEVEVYRHDPGGWYAIRPVPNSFSWVSGRYLDVREDGLAVVREENVAARVGSHLQQRRDVIQVRLRKGEVVEILGKEEIPNGTGTTTWYKISPPAGEFRWVFGKYVDPDYPVDGLRKTTPETAMAQAHVPQSATSPTNQVSAAPQAPDAGQPAPKGGQSSPPVAAGVPNLPAASPQEAGAMERSGWAPAASGAASITPAPGTSALVPTSGAPSGTFEEQLRQIETNLSMMVVAEPAAWSFDALRKQAESLLASAQTSAERGKARVLVNKIVRFEDIKQRYLAIAALRRQTEQSNRYLAALNSSRPGSGLRSGGDERYDGVGQLIRVVSPKLGAPRYALVDEQGQVRCYVSPAPGVNLRHYLGQRVGVVGTRGYIPEQQAMHVMARHVHPLDAPALR